MGIQMRTPRWTATIVATGLLMLGIPVTAAQADSGAETTLVVTLAAGTPHAEAVAEQAISAAGGTVSEVQQITDTAVAVTVAATATQAASIGAKAEDADGVRAAEPSRKVYSTATNDTYYSYLWNLNSAAGSTHGVNAEAAWATSTGSGSVVGVIDTGITAHSDLTGSDSSIVGGNAIAGYDFISDSTNAGDGGGWDANPTDEGDFHLNGSTLVNSSWHGTHVAGTIAAIGNNGKGVVGVAPGAKVQPIRVLGRSGGAEEDLLAAVTWGAGLSVEGVPNNPTPADVLNLSLGGDGSCPVGLQTAINNAVAAGTVVVVAAGNSNDAIINHFPANCANVVRVVATTYEGTRASYSNYGTSGMAATISAPGGSGQSGSDPTDWIASTVNSGTTTQATPSYAWMVGTSMAAPHVSAVVALAKAADPSLTVNKLVGLLTSTASPAVSCSTTACGAGIVNARDAVAAAVNSPDPTPTLSDDLPLSVTKPALSGAAKVGSTLTASSSATPTAAVVTWRWTIRGATVSTAAAYTPTVADLGLDLTVQATATHNAVSQVASTVVRVAAGTFTKVSAPKITGTFTVARQVKATAGTWAPAATSTSYQWLRDGKNIKKATKSTYRLAKADRRHKISVRITVRRSGFITAWADSAKYKVR
jgi:serine protease